LSGIENYDLMGFGSGIDGGKHYPELIKFVENLPNVENKKAFIFSTSAIYNEKKMLNEHKTVREILQNKGFIIIKEFGCPGYTTRSIFNIIGGKNKDRPNDEDIKNTEIFAKDLWVSLKTRSVFRNTPHLRA
jgi:flavodoxin